MKSILCFLALCSTAFASDAEGIAFFEQKIRPVLIEHCYSCHSEKSEKLRGNLLLDSKAGWEKGGDSGEPAIVPSKPDESPLIASIQHLELEMPPDKPKLSDTVIADLVTWIRMGAPDPRDQKIQAKRGDKSWWSLQPIPKAIPHANENRVSSVDEYVESQLHERGLRLSLPADPRTLIRRMSYDVIGLPPTPDEVIVFENDFSEDADKASGKLIDRLLASPHYGEQWGRHWLDVVRFGESNGFERNFVIDDLWPFRDYVIRSINEDKPFNRLIVEHLAGDVVGKGQPDVEVGSAFLVAGPYDDVGNQDLVAQASIRAATIDDMITATSGAFLGLTIHCARCHHHKFDPIPTEDYYRLRSAFEGVSHGRRAVVTPEQQKAFANAMKPLNEEKSELTKSINRINEAVDERCKLALAASPPTRPKIDFIRTEEIFAPVEARYLRFVMHANTSNPKSANNSRITEFEVWSDTEAPKNVALASNGTTAEGERSAAAEDFPEAYGPQLAIDGLLGEQWFIGSPAVLKLTFAKPERIHRVAFANATGNEVTLGKVRGSTPTDYHVEVSIDDEHWHMVTSSSGREPWSQEHAIEQMRKQIIAEEEKSELARLNKRLSGIEKRMKAVTPLQQMWVGKHEQPKGPTFVHKGGDPMKPTDAIAPSSLDVLDQVVEPYELDSEVDQGERRLALARWITNDTNPLTARVLANRIWQYHFGTGIVDTPSDFGFLGSQPTHPELLDYLARRLIDHSWQIKKLHREILLSRTYRQASQDTRSENIATGLQLDQSARLLWRFPPRRLNAEEIRDTLLCVVGQLDLKMGGPGFRLYKFTQNNVCTYFPLDKHGPETYRRAVYHQNARASVVDVLNDFDLPDIAFASPKRANTTTPLQALTMLNHSFTQDMATAFADRLADVGGDPIRQAFALAFQREPTDSERQASTQLIQSHGIHAYCRALLNANELIYLE